MTDEEYWKRVRKITGNLEILYGPEAYTEKKRELWPVEFVNEPELIKLAFLGFKKNGKYFAYDAGGHDDRTRNTKDDRGS